MSQAPSIPSITYRPSADCAYSMLVSKIKGKPIELGRRSPEVKKEEEPKVEVVEEPLIPVPDSELQTVVDKIAAYVAKNGPDFESVVRSKGTTNGLQLYGLSLSLLFVSSGDPRFMFLDPNHQFHPYYRQRTQYFTDELRPNKNSKLKSRKYYFQGCKPTVY
jgi:hypothetical protein